MSRPKSAEDRDRFPTPCARCAEHRAQAANWPDGYICQNCYRKAIRTVGKCVTCGHQGILPGLTSAGSTCRVCSGITINVDCRGCGKEDEVYSAGLCWSCVLSRLVDEALADPFSGVVSPDLQSFAHGLKQMKRANSGLTWIRQGHVQEFLGALAKSESITHELVDSLPRSVTRSHVRALLVEHGALPRRDEYLANYLEWAEGKLSLMTSVQDQICVRQ